MGSRDLPGGAYHLGGPAILGDGFRRALHAQPASRTPPPEPPHQRPRLVPAAATEPCRQKPANTPAEAGDAQSQGDTSLYGCTVAIFPAQLPKRALIAPGVRP